MAKKLDIKKLVETLSNQPAMDNVANPYVKKRYADNLQGYMELLLSYPYSGHLLVGEAPGYKGCTQCGIPFTSQRVINERKHPFIQELRKVVAVNENQTEITATKVWNQLEGKVSIPAFWNTFPFHPQKKDDPTKNRAPTPEETAIGMKYLDLVVDIFNPHTIVAVGGVAASLLHSRYPKVQFRNFSHPSMRGYPNFLLGFSQLGLT